MKTKSLLFAALVSISFATTSCQNEENIMPNAGTSYYSNEKNTSKTVIIDEKEAILDENVLAPTTENNENLAKPKTSQPKATPPTNIMQSESYEVK